VFLILLIAGIAIATRADSKAMEPPPRLEIGPRGEVRLASGRGQQISQPALEIAAANPHPWPSRTAGRFDTGIMRGNAAPGAPSGSRFM
jgi:hypothetical protein